MKNLKKAVEDNGQQCQSNYCSFAVDIFSENYDKRVFTVKLVVIVPWSLGKELIDFLKSVVGMMNETRLENNEKDVHLYRSLGKVNNSLTW